MVDFRWTEKSWQNVVKGAAVVVLAENWDRSLRGFGNDPLVADHKRGSALSHVDGAQLLTDLRQKASKLHLRLYSMFPQSIAIWLEYRGAFACFVL